MQTEWIEPFQQEMTHLDVLFNTLITRHEPVHPSETDLLAWLKWNLEICSQWSQALRPDPSVWRLIHPRSLLHDVLSLFTVLSGSLEVIIKLRESRTLSNDPTEALYQDMLSHTQQAIRHLRMIPDRHIELPFSPNDPPHHLHPVAVTTLLRVLMPRLAYGSELEALIDWPLTLYHPDHTTEMLYHLVNRLLMGDEVDEEFDREENTVVLLTTRSADFFELSFRGAALRLTPVLWDDILNDLHVRRGTDAIEMLREMGGDIEPLTWNEGQGEGVLVRLPWASSSG